MRKDRTEYQKERLEIAKIALSGLLASGHFTVPSDEDDHPVPCVHDNGEKWKEAGCSQRCEILAVSAAFQIAEDFLMEVEHMEVLEED